MVAEAMAAGLPIPPLHGNIHEMRNRSQKEKEDAAKQKQRDRSKRFRAKK